jgi:hypothetical protein
MMVSVKFRVAFIEIALSLLVTAHTLSGQVTGTMSGYVSDPSGAAIPEAAVTATLVEQNATRTTVTNVEGFYNFGALPPGVYVVSVEKSAGFERLVKNDVKLTVNQNVRLDFQLRLGSVSEQVTVTGEAPLVDTRSATVSGLVDDRRVVDLPLNGRNVIALAATVPGVLNVSAPQRLDDARSGPAMNVNGGQINMNNFTFDGGYFVNPSRNTPMNYPPPDALQEFRILTSSFSAEYGRNMGSQVNVVSRAGSNDLHGSLWEFLRNDALNARNFFSDTVPGEKQNQFGGAAGGRIRRDKLFFFGSYQGLRDRPQAVPAVAFVPSTAHRSGDFSDLLPATVLSNPTDILTGQSFVDSTGAPCVSHNIIRQNCISPVATNLLQFVPVSPSGSVTSLGSNPKNDDMYMGRIDVNQSSKHSVFGHAFVDHNTATTPFGGSGNIAGYLGENFVQETDMVTLNDTYAITPNLLNQAVVSYLRTTSFESETRTTPPSEFGINMPQYPPTGAVEVDIRGAFNLGSGFTTRFINNNYQFRDMLSLMKGRHNFKFGGEVLGLHFIQRFIGSPGFTFDGSRSGDPVADFMLGSYASLSLDFGVRDNDDLQTAPSFFFQDEFKVKPRFTLTYGIRYEPMLPWYDNHNRIEALVYGAKSTVIPDAPPGLLFPGDRGIPRSLVPADKNNFAPRIGLAWDVFGDGRTSVRAAYGVFYDSIKADSLSQENPPWAGFGNAYNGRIENPFTSTGQQNPPAAPSGKFGCVPISQFPGTECPLFPLPVGGLFIDQTLRAPYVQNWNFALQRQLTQDLMLELSYIGHVGTKIEGWKNYNPAEYVNDPVTGDPPSLNNANNRVVHEPGILAPYGILLGNDNRSWYHSLQAQLTKRLSRGVSVTGSYTLSKSIDTYSSNIYGYTFPNPFNLRDNRGRSDWDRRHAFVASWLWSPTWTFSGPWKRAALGGWTLTGITSIQSGDPLTFVQGQDVAEDGTNGGILGIQHAQLAGGPIARSHSSRADMVAQFFNASAFVPANLVPRGVYGDAGRGILSGPAVSNTDFSAIKDFRFKERYRVQFRSEFFNVFNQVNFNDPDVSASDGSTFGQILGARSGRVIQFALKFLW